MKDHKKKGDVIIGDYLEDVCKVFIGDTRVDLVAGYLS